MKQKYSSERNFKVVKMGWRFYTVDACIELKRLYPKIHN